MSERVLPYMGDEWDNVVIGSRREDFARVPTSKCILFLDDNPARRKWASRELGPGNSLFHAETARQAIDALMISGVTFEEVYLDHDLGETEYQDSSEPNTGMEVVRWIVANRPTIGRVIVHSLNAPAANEMVAKLAEAGYEATYTNFMRLAQEAM